MTDLRVERATRAGVAFLQSAQNTDGSFDSFSSPTKSPFTRAKTYRTTFGPALILGALNAVKTAAAEPVRHKLAAWLLTQKSPYWSFNYWAVDAPQRDTLPYPDDLDDTFCALIALYGYSPKLVDETCLGLMTRLLIAAESQVGGPYRTWLVAGDAPNIWRDVDLAVNSNIAYFLQTIAEPLPNVTLLMEQALLTHNFTSPYYPSEYQLVYYLSRAYTGKHKSVLANYLTKRRRSGWWGTPLRTALAISALAHLQRAAECDTAVERLLAAQLPDGSWPAEAMCLDPAMHGKKFFSGSPALTTALALEALARFSNTAKPATKSPKRHDPVAAELRTTIVNEATRELSFLKPELKRLSLDYLEQMQQNDTNNEILLLPYIFNRSLTRPLPSKSLDNLVRLGLANLYGWIAYTIYDDFLDDEGQPAQLSIANVALRHSLHNFRLSVASPDFRILVDETFNAIDSANAWELAHCRFAVTNKAITVGKLPRYGGVLRLSERSLGHTLTPLGVLANLGISPDDKRAVAVKKALQHYIVARQLNDDLHDWEKDIRAGQITYVVAAILQDLSIKPGNHSFLRLLPAMQRQFWHHTVVDICHTALKHAKLARKEAARSQLLKPTNIITILADNVAATAQTTLNEQAGAERFLEAYQEGGTGILGPAAK